MFSSEFLDLNLRFATKIALISQQPLASALLNYTHIYLAFGLGRDFDPNHPAWKSYTAGLGNTPNLLAWTYDFYVARQAHLPRKTAQPDFGCFSYALWPDHRVRLHFHNGETTDVSPLSEKQMRCRLAELTAMFAHLKHHAPDAAKVVGGSWLYNIEGYRRLFPLGYLATAHVGHDDFQFVALWGQFLDRHGQLRQSMSKAFVDCIQQQTTLEGLLDCFPYKVLRMESAIEEFYDFYRVT